MSVMNSIERTWDNRGIAFYPGSNMYKLISVLMTEADRQIDTAGVVNRANKIRTAEGEVLDRFGYAVNLPRKSGETDDKYRIRIKLQYRLNSIEGTMDEVAQFISSMLEVNPENINLDTRFDTSTATLYISAQASVWDSAPLTRVEIEEFAGQVVSAGHRVLLEETGTFILTNDTLLSQQGHIAEYGLTSDSISTGGTLAADIVTE